MWTNLCHEVNDSWLRALKDLLSSGSLAIPRGQRTSEILTHRTNIPMSSPIITVESRKLNYQFMLAEALWILMGDDTVAGISPYCKNISKFSDDGQRFFGAYGPKILAQLPYVVDAFVQDIWTRQAVINIWRESPPPTKDVPCTISLQFISRDNLLHVVATMRSSDVWLGHPYDVFNFSMIGAYVLLCLKERMPNTFSSTALGNLILTAGSKHLYERNEEAASNVLVNPNYRDYLPMSIHEFKTPGSLLNHLVTLRDKRFNDLKQSFMKELTDLI